MATKAVTDANFDSEVLKSSKPVVLDFWAEWCGPCKMIAPALEELSKEMADKIEVKKINIDQNQMTPMKYGIRGIPTLMLFKDGQVASTKVGALSKSQMVDWVKETV